MNILDYLDWRGDLTLTERPFNEVDNLILSTLVYLNMEGIVPEDPRASVELSALPDAYRAAGYDQSTFFSDPLPLLKKAAVSARFGRVRVGRYCNLVDPAQQIQFAAATFTLGDGTVYIAFRGTDDTIVGWREDFNFSLMSETPGQSEAVAYVNAVAADTDCPLRIGGHSKGGNFAVYAAAFCDAAAKRRIETVYSNDGPGFVREIAESDAYRSVLDRIEKIIPESSLVGILLSGAEQHRVVSSGAHGIMQHNPYSWNILGQRFVAADRRDPVSVFMDETLSRWVDTLSDVQKKALIGAIFDSLEASGVTTLSEIKANRLVTYNAIYKAIRSIAPEEQTEVGEALRSLLLTGRDVLQEELNRRIDAWEQLKNRDPQEKDVPPAGRTSV